MIKRMYGLACEWLGHGVVGGKGRMISTAVLPIHLRQRDG
jgi:hypothetical protein